MAIYITEQKICFIHIPKTGGSSIQKWLHKNTDCVQPKKTLHCSLEHAKTVLPEIKTSFCVVRNPWDWCVSWYHYQIKRANMNINYILQNSNKIDLRKQKYNIETQKNILKELDKGFDNWLKNCNHAPQIQYSQNIDLVLRFENLNHEFKKIQHLVNCFSPLEKINTTNRTHYQKYYNNKTIDIVYNKYKQDIQELGYKYETP